MKKILIPFLSIFLTAVFSFNVAFADGIEKDKAAEKNKKSIQGKVFDKKTGEALAGVKVYIVETQQTVYTDLDGNFELSGIERGTYNIVLSFISYNENRMNNIKIDPAKNKVLEFTIE